MNKCNICKTEQKKINTITFAGGKNQLNIPMYNIDLLMYIKGKWICNKCMDIHHKVYALITDTDFSVGEVDYYADGRNLE